MTTVSMQQPDIAGAVKTLQMLQTHVLLAIRPLRQAAADPVPDQTVATQTAPSGDEPPPVAIVPASKSFLDTLEIVLNYSTTALLELGGKLPPG